MSSEYQEFIPRSEEQIWVDDTFLACKNYYDQIAKLNSGSKLTNTTVPPDVLVQEYAEVVDGVFTLAGSFYNRDVDDTTRLGVPSQSFYVSNKREAVEQFKLLPLRDFTIIVDNIFPTDRAEEWYEHAVNAIVARDEFHGNSCMVITNKNTPSSCRFSTECPRKSVKRTLLTPALTADFRDDSHKFIPDKQADLVALKLNVAAKTGIEDRQVAFGALELYRKAAKVALSSY